MTPRQAKKIALATCAPFVDYTTHPLAVHAMYLQAEYARMAEQVILRTLRDILRNSPGATCTRVQDTFIIDTITPLEARRIELDLRITHHGAIFQELPCRPMVSPG